MAIETGRVEEGKDAEMGRTVESGRLGRGWSGGGEGKRRSAAPLLCGEESSWRRRWSLLPRLANAIAAFMRLSSSEALVERARRGEGGESVSEGEREAEVEVEVEAKEVPGEGGGMSSLRGLVFPLLPLESRPGPKVIVLARSRWPFVLTGAVAGRRPLMELSLTV